MHPKSAVDIKRAASLLREGGLVAFPTETVYGLGASVFSPNAIKKIFEIKKRPQDNPLIVHISSFKQMTLIVEPFHEELVEVLARHFWPGPLTLVLPKKNTVPSIVSAGLSSIGVRMPAHLFARQLIEAAGEPLAAPSANLSGYPSSTTAAHVREDFGDQVMILDGGPCIKGLESTVLALDPLMILRPGTITKEELEEVIGEKISIAEEGVEKPPSPGMKYTHYSPQAKVRLIEEGEIILPSPKILIVQSIKPEELYARFREADNQGIEEIVVHCDQTIKSNAALMNRLLRAAQ